ncbi:ATP synthase F1 subunit delta [Neolewinella antarctica]|uniref:ATP synthase subunit delta n=1 Tax=Neolewinella antarctica TaxID=442734 RepID=A0ABX0XDI8_9BACT|nr:ATP synthase F1 subunit delta [Neolewinella antarctica]NJC26822.1 F-type H+-transporting ATPase subunit delta [Neolewinella antarctica]
MTNQRVADRYAKSLLDLAVERAQLDVIKGDVDDLLSLTGNRDVANLLASPIINPSKKKAIFSELLDKVGVTPLTKVFVDVLITKGREPDLIGILKAFIKQYKKLNNISTVKVTSAIALSATELDDIKKQLIAGGKTETTVDIETSIDPSIIGGFILEFGGQVYDASVAHKLSELRKEIA